MNGIFFLPFPLLRDFTIRGITDIEELFMRMTAPCLEKLKIETSVEVMPWIWNCTNLTHLSLKSLQSETTSESIVVRSSVHRIPNLRSCQFLDQPNLPAIMGQLDLPMLEILHVRGPYDMWQEVDMTGNFTWAMADLLQRSMPPLTELVLSGIHDHSELDSQLCLREAIHLVRLGFSDCSIMDTGISVLSASVHAVSGIRGDSKDLIVCPKLEVLRLDWCYNITSDTLAGIFDSRLKDSRYARLHIETFECECAGERFKVIYFDELTDFTEL